MTAPIPEEHDPPPVEADDPPGEHASELPADDDRTAASGAQEENAETSADEPSDGSGGE